MDTLRSSTGAESVFKGFRAQTLYIVNRILNQTKEEYQFQPEGEEDLAVYDKDGVLIEVVQIKNYSSNLTLSSLSPEKEDSFLRRSINLLNKEQTKRPKIKLLSFGQIGPELYNGIRKDEKDRENIFNKLKNNYNYLQEDIMVLFKHLDVVKVQEKIINDKIERTLKNNPQVTVDYKAGFNLLMYWIYQLSEKGDFVNRKLLLEKLDQIGMFLNERIGFHEEYGTSIIPLDYIEDDSEETIKRLKEEFYIGVSAKYGHIKNGLDVIREDKIEAIKNEFAKNNIVIIHGASGQGKSTLAYRYLYQYHPDNYSYKINYINSKNHARKIINTLYGISKSVDVPLIIYIDVKPGDRQWTEIVREIASIYSKFKVIITVREEDWKRSSLAGADLIFSELELKFNKIEAENIYESLIKRKADMRFRDFEESWLHFGEEGPLLEFTYLITQGSTLRARLKEQIELIQKEIAEGKDEKLLELLKIVSLADSYGGKIDLSTIISQLELSSPEYILHLLEKEYLLRKSNDGRYLIGLHPVRSNILAEILFADLIINPKDKYLKNCITALAEEDLHIFLLHCFVKENPEEILDFLNELQLKTWKGYGGVINSLLWYGIKEYINLNKNTIDKAYKKFGYGWSLVLGFDLSKAMLNYPRNIFEELEGFNINQEANDLINDCNQTLFERSNEIYKYAKTYFKNTNLPVNNPEIDKEWSSFGEVLFWLGKFGIDKNINFTNYNFNTGLQNIIIDDIANAIAGLYYYNMNNSREILNKIRPDFVGKVKKGLNIPLLEEDTDIIKMHFIFDIKEAEKSDTEEENIFHQQTIKIINIFRKIYPDKKIISSQGYGHKFDIIPYDHDDTYKKIPIRNLPLPWLTKINSIFSELASYEYRPDSWQEYVNGILNKREKAISLFQDIIKGMEKHFKSEIEINIIGDYIAANKWVNLKREFGFQIPFPKTIIDEWGYTSEYKNEGNNNLLLSEIAFNLTRYNKFKELYRKFETSVQNFMHFTFNFLLVKSRIKNKKREEKEQILNLFRSNNIELNNHSLLLSFNSIKNILTTLEPFQYEFDYLFSKYVEHAKLQELEKQERDVYQLFLAIWDKFAANYFKYEMDIISKSKQYLLDIKEAIKENIKKGLNDLCSNEVDIKLETVNNYKEHKKSKIILLYLNDPFVLVEYMVEIVKILRETLRLNDNDYSKRVILETEYPHFIIVPLMNNNLISPVVYNIKLYRILDIEDQNIGFFDLLPEPIDEDSLKQLSFSVNNRDNKLMNLAIELQKNLINLYSLVVNLVQLNKLGELIEEEKDFLILQEYFQTVAEDINIFFQNIFDILDKIINIYNKKDLADNPERAEFLSILSEIHEKIIPEQLKKDKSEEGEINGMISLKMMKEWKGKIEEVMELAFIVIIYIAKEVNGRWAKC